MKRNATNEEKAISFFCMLHIGFNVSHIRHCSVHDITSTVSCKGRMPYCLSIVVNPIDRPFAVPSCVM